VARPRLEHAAMTENMRRFEAIATTKE